MVVDDSRDAAVGVVLGSVLGGFVLALLEVEVNWLVRQAELLKDDGDLPAWRII